MECGLCEGMRICECGPKIGHEDKRRFIAAVAVMQGLYAAWDIHEMEKSLAPEDQNMIDGMALIARVSVKQADILLASGFLSLEQKLRAAEYLLKEAKTFIDEKFEYFDEENDRGALDILHLFDRFESGEFDALRDGGANDPK